LCGPDRPFSHSSAKHLSCHAASHRVASRRIASRRATPRRARPRPRHAMPMSCRSTLFSRSRPRPSSRLRSQQWKCIDRRMAERASGPVFPHSFSLSLPPARLPVVSFSTSAPSFTSSPSSLLRSIFFSSETHFPHLPATVCLCLPPPLSLSLSLSLLFLYVALVLTMETHSPSSRRSSPFTLTTTLVVDSHPRDATHRAERKYLCRCIVSRFLSSRGILTCDQYSRCQRNCQSYMPSI